MSGFNWNRVHREKRLKQGDLTPRPTKQRNLHKVFNLDTYINKISEFEKKYSKNWVKKTFSVKPQDPTDDKYSWKLNMYNAYTEREKRMNIVSDNIQGETMASFQTDVEIYTDGGCYPNPGHGGWAVVIVYKDGTFETLRGSMNSTTNNRMEMTALIKAAQFMIKKNYSAVVYTDSQYLINGFTKWMSGWNKKGWKKVKNPDLWQELFRLEPKLGIKLKWVRGHAENKYNNIADEIANAEMMKL